MGVPRNSQKSSLKKRSTTLGYLFKLESKANDIHPTSPPPSPSSQPEIDELVSLISYCTYVFTFTDRAESPTQQDLKRHKLTQILSFLRSAKHPLDDWLLPPLVSMLAANLFRPLPPSANPCVLSDSLDDDTPAMVLAPSWPHLNVVYDILSALVMILDPKTLRIHVGHAFLSSLLAVFQSEDPRERDRLKNAYHLLYSRLAADRSFMRRSMSHVFLRFAFEAEQRHCGIGELLEIWGSIINGFSVPIKEEHRVFLMRVLVPLHKPKGMQAYHRQLSYCVSQFVRKEPGLGEGVVRGVLRGWPVTNCQKEVLLIGELEDLVENTGPEEFDKVAVPLCSQIAKCLNSCNSQVAERALYVWNNEQFVRMASRSMEDVLPAIVEGIEKNIKWHWNKPVQQLTMSVKRMLEDMEPRLYSKCLRDLDHRESVARQEEMERREKWEKLETAAANRHFLQPPNCVCVSY